MGESWLERVEGHPLTSVVWEMAEDAEVGRLRRVLDADLLRLEDGYRAICDPRTYRDGPTPLAALQALAKEMGK